MSDNFYYKLILLLIESLKNNYHDNYDHLRFGEIKPENLILKKFFKTKSIENKYIDKSELNSIIQHVDEVLNNKIFELESIYTLLEDTYSKNVFLQLIAFRILGNKFVKLHVNTPEYWENINKIESLADKNNVIDPKFLFFVLCHFDLNELNIPVKLFFTASGIYNCFVAEQYSYKNNSFLKVQKGDIVIDAGACWGDSALYFASLVGKDGKVYGFEFVKENIQIFNTNIQLNRHLSPIITLIEKPLWSKSGVSLSISVNGPGSNVSSSNESELHYLSISLDDFVESNYIKRVDFIKMDIEGAELDALMGAEQSIRKYTPKLAISIYHSINDFVKIPLWIFNLNLGYKLYLDHYTIHSEETVIYAIV